MTLTQTGPDGLKHPTPELCDFFWGQRNEDKDSVLREMDLAPKGGGPLNLEQRRRGLLAAVENRKVTMFHKALERAGVCRRLNRSEAAAAAPSDMEQTEFGAPGGLLE